ncbi:hypothetical protein AB0L41_48480 [Amycolatopsis mediterranei]|uniref:hypothetical protein n=1 Tax=Amycolatopsis mediterranei TaxID=33910 RepID=UPI00342AB073
MIRCYSGDRRRHAYAADDLTGHGYQQVHPVSHVSLGYDLTHPTDMISPAEYRDLGSLFDGCGTCRRWLHNTPHEVVIAEELAIMPNDPRIPDPRSMRRDPFRCVPRGLGDAPAPGRR